MILFEGRKEEGYKRYQKAIDIERDLTSPNSISFYDILISNDFIKQSNFKYLEPLLKQYYVFWFEYYYSLYDDSKDKGQGFNYSNYLYGITDAILPKVKFFDSNKDKYPSKDINSYIGKQFDSDFLDLTDSLIADYNIKKEKEIAKKDTVKIYEDNKVLIVRPYTHEASCFYGAGTKWCTTTKGVKKHFANYTTNGALYYIILKKVEKDNMFYKIAISANYDSKIINSDFWDAEDRLLSMSEKKLFFALVPSEAIAKMQEDLDNSGDDKWIEKITKKIYDAKDLSMTKSHKLKNGEELKITFKLFDIQPLPEEMEDVNTGGYMFACSYGISPNKEDMEMLVDIGTIYGWIFNQKTSYRISVVLESAMYSLMTGNENEFSLDSSTFETRMDLNSSFNSSMEKILLSMSETYLSNLKNSDEKL